MSKPTKTTKKAKVAIISTQELLADTKAIMASIDSAVSDTVALQRIYQVIGCSVIQHLAINKDIMLVRRLFDKMSVSLNVNSMKEFINKYAPVSFDDEGEVHYDKTRDVKLGEAMENAWWKAKAQAPYKPFDFNAELDKLLKRATSKLEKPKEGDEVTQEQIQAVRAVFYRIKPELTDELPTLEDAA